MRRRGLLVALVAAAGIAMTVPAPAQENYVVLKGGFYSPNSNDLKNFSSGFNGEAALGFALVPNFAAEAGIGYFSTDRHGTKVSAVPFTATAKARLPLDAVELYAGAGLGAYAAKLDTGGSSSTDTAFGYHVLAGAQADITRGLFVGAEVKYLWAKAAFDSGDVKLNGYATTINLGMRF